LENKDYDFQIHIYQKAGNDYKLMPFKFQPRPVCDYYDNDNVFAPEMVETTDFPKKVNKETSFLTYSIIL